MRHLTEQQARAALKRGAAVEQVLSASLEAGTVEWVRAHPAGASLVLHLHRTLDEGSTDFLDVYEFSPTDEEEEFGEGLRVGEYPSTESLFQAAADLGARPDRWVNDGLVQNEYLDLRTRQSDPLT
ncbi:hypothetical protein ABN028_34735 [Actinopolymorpha sp. B17G11]|uniref:hypothetical protein n=1 Tax=Actinopolymorpha sp. B17G11 TaxID=3160861 RepID=UPI0032E518DE